MSSLHRSWCLCNDLHNVRSRGDVREVTVSSLQLFGQSRGRNADRESSYESPIFIQHKTRNVNVAISCSLKHNIGKHFIHLYTLKCATYAGVRVIILTPIYFFFAAALPRDGQPHNTNTINHPLACNSLNS